jgi:hypothetical protein
MEVRADPWSLVSWEETATGRLRGEATYAYRRIKAEAKAAAQLLRWRL